MPLTILVGLLISPLVIFILTRQPHSSIPKQISQRATYPAGRTLAKTVPSLIPEHLVADSSPSVKVFANQVLQTLPSNYDCQKEKCVALTFDDGPNADSTKLILDTLTAHFVHASFFEIGKKIAGQESLIQRMHREGHDIGNHSWSHPFFSDLKPKQIRQQVRLTQQAVEAAGVPAPHLFRPPYEDFLLSMQKDIKLPVILWNVDPKDWAYKNPKTIAKIVEKQIKPGAIVVMHDKMATAKALNKVLTDLGDEYKFVTVSQLLDLKAGSEGIYVSR